MRDDSDHLVNHQELVTTLEIPNVASPIVICADLKRRSVCVSMSLLVPRDKKRSSSRINWILRQINKAKTDGIHVRAIWPGRAPATQAPLGKLNGDPSLIEAENKSMLPSQFEVMLIRDLGPKFSGSKTFIEQLEDAVPSFYEQVGQYLREYVLSPPKLQREPDADDALEEVAEEAETAASEAMGHLVDEDRVADTQQG